MFHDQPKCSTISQTVLSVDLQRSKIEKVTKVRIRCSKGFCILTIERFCIPFYGIFKTESLSDQVRVRPAASRRWLSTKTVLHFVGRFGGFI